VGEAVTPEQASFTSRLHAYAYQGIERGLSIIPPREDGSKRPDGGWNLYQTRLPTRHEIDQWYSIPRTGIGIICGKVSGNLEMMEFEDHETYVAFLLAANEDGLSELINLISEGYMEESPNGGRHWLYRCPEIAGNTKLAQNENKKVLIETRGNGGYVIVAPSNGHVHPTDRPYKLLSGGFDTIANISKAERGRLHKLARSFDRSPKEHAETPTPAAEGSRSGVRPGDDYNKRGSWNELLEAHGWALMFTRGEVQYWRRPGKQTRDWSATVGHEHDEQGNPALWVFSTSTPFKSERVYNKFGAYMVLKEKDAESAARELGAAGYGDPPKKPETKEEEKPKPKLLIIQPAGTMPTRPKPKPYCAGLLDEGELLVLGAARASYKSWWGMDFANLLAKGEGQFMGTFPIQQSARVLYAHGEIDDWAAYERWEKLNSNEENLFETFERWRIRATTNRANIDGISVEYIDATLDPRVEATVEEKEINVLIIDPWKNFYSGRENDNDQTEAALDKLRDLQLRYGLTVIIMHHFGKNSEVREPEDLWRGASRLADWASTRVTLRPFYTKKQMKDMGMTRHQARKFATASFLRRLSIAPDDIPIKWNLETGQWEWWRPPAGTGDTDIVQGLTAIEVAKQCPSNGWESTRQASIALGVSKNTADKMLEEAKMQGLLENFKGPHNSKGWCRPGPKLPGTDQRGGDH